MFIAVAAASLMAATVPTSSAIQSDPFGINPVADTTLSAVKGTYSSPGFGRNARSAIDQNARSTFDAMAGINRTTFDNWFAREGLALLATTALGRPLILN